MHIMDMIPASDCKITGFYIENNEIFMLIDSFVKEGDKN
jgi:hypothetical protein